MIDFEELAYHQTPLGELSLRRRTEPRANNQLIYEVKLNDEFLMSSLFTASEEALATLGIAAVDASVAGDALELVVGGLGLGYTARAALDTERVAKLWVIDTLADLIGWHERGLVPLGRHLSDDSRCEFVHADFFKFPELGSALLSSKQPSRLFDAILLDIDHSPSHWLASSNSGFYSAGTLEMLAQQLHSHGVFALWSNDPESEEFMRLLRSVFAVVAAHRVEFPNPYTDGVSGCTVYVCNRSVLVS
jgi:spermidine synthase